MYNATFDDFVRCVAELKRSIEKKGIEMEKEICHYAREKTKREIVPITVLYELEQAQADFEY